MHAVNSTGDNGQESGVMPLIWKSITILMQSPLAKSINAILFLFISTLAVIRYDTS